MTEKTKLVSLEKILATSVGGPCAFPENVAIPINSSQIKLEKNGINGDNYDDLRFEQEIKRMLKDGELEKMTEEELGNLLAALQNQSGS
ncbi:MAG: hypothetical protein UU12_C0002G0002 [Candidatus Woesebacteria bacterium GW2011_GWA2_40_7b]|uniref:Uncharacterized protein n=1 Tax=Candidatus Woesebacteria bacterium GW2011_GWA2_40_7b TaxID=1618563 RepID=A0A0G0T2T5_9BACT|nr:MAG: hypothetical protein UU12_C0002G0002 [Candidatus Woesebacteria bacterium GW2011_GWA2_40_7b]